MKEEVGYLVKGVSDRKHKELTPSVVYQIFEDNYIGQTDVFSVPECHFKQEDGIWATVTIQQGKEKRIVETGGNGRLDAVSNALKMYFGISYELAVYEEHAISKGSSCKDKMYWGVGLDEDIIKASISALVAAVNKLAKDTNVKEGREERIVDILNFIQNHYTDVSLDELAENFNLSKPYLSKEKSGMTFQDAVKKARMKKAKVLLRESNQNVETIAASVGYENVEHFNRLFKKEYAMTPLQYRNAKNQEE